MTVWITKDAAAAGLPRDSWPALERVAQFGHQLVAVSYVGKAERGHVVAFGGHELIVAEVFAGAHEDTPASAGELRYRQRVRP